MKKFALGIGVAMGLLAVSSVASAQYYDPDSKADRRFYISPLANYSLYDSDRRFDDEIGYQLALGKIVSRGANIELHGMFAEPGSDIAGSPDGELLSYGVTVLLFQWRNSFPLYGILSIARGKTEAANGGGSAKSDQFDFGLGYMLELDSLPLMGKGAALRFEARYRTDKYDNGQAETYNSLFNHGNDRTYHDGVLGIGLYLPLGADPSSQKNVEEPATPKTSLVVTQPDSDGDQIPDHMDACPDTPPGAIINAQGCEHDSDGDGVSNSKDNCPGTPAGQAVDAQGCPLDSDADGVANHKDQCPNTPDGLAVLADGCAIKGDCRIPKAGQRIDASGCAVGAVILKGVNFETASAELTASAKNVLDGVAKILSGAGDIRIEVAGHTDAVGAAQFNKNLSQLRADSVKQYLISQGVASRALIAKGYGESQPLVTNDSAAGRESNRRVELKLKN